MQTVELVGRLLIALAVVLGAIWLIAKKARGTSSRAKLRSGKLIDVLGRQSLSRGSSVAVVRVADKALIIGVTETNVRVLGEMELDVAAAHIAATDPSTKRSATEATAPRRRGSDTFPEAAFATFPAPAEYAEPPVHTAAPTRPAAHPDLVTTAATQPAPAGRLSGSALSPATWKQTIDALREMTARKG